MDENYTFIPGTTKPVCRMAGAGAPYDRSETITEHELKINLSVGPLVSLTAGILIWIVPRMLNYISALYLIIIELPGLVGASALHLRGDEIPAA